jgi:hypothetical protein
MTDRLLPDWLEGFTTYTENTEPPFNFRLWTGISTVAAVLKRKCILNYGHLRIFPNMYIMLISPPGQARKGTAIGFGVDFLMRADVKLCADRVTKESLVRNIKNAYENDISTDGTSIRHHCSYTIVSPELTVLIGRNDVEMISWLADWFDCGKGPDGIWEYDTKTQGKDKITGLWVNWLGATTPDLLGMVPEIIGSGLSSRIIFVFEEKHGKIQPYPYLSDEEKNLGDNLYHDLELIQMMGGEFKHDKSFVDVWFEWYPKQMENPPFTDPRLARYCTRRGINAMKLSMILNASRGCDMLITAQDLTRAITILEKTEIKMPNAFNSMGESPHAKVISDVMREIGTAGRVTLAQLTRMHYHDVSDPRIMEGIIKTLENMGYCTVGQIKGEVIITYKDEK